MNNLSKMITTGFGVTALCLGLAAASSMIARADGEGHHHHHGKWQGAAAKVCEGQADHADKRACFKQLREQRKAAMEAFDKGFTYTPASGSAPAAPTTSQ